MIIKNVFKIWILNNLDLTFKTYLTVINNHIQKDKQLDKDKVLFNAIKEEKVCIKAKHKVFINFATIKSNAKP